MTIGGPWDADPDWFAKNGYAWSDTAGWYLPVTTQGGFHAKIDPRDATITHLTAELEAARAENAKLVESNKDLLLALEPYIVKAPTTGSSINPPPTEQPK